MPHIDLLLQSLRINRERLNSKSKIAIDAKLLRMLLQALAASVPFSAEFYLKAYPDIAEAHAAGQIEDLRRHFVELGFFEGRMGCEPPVDEAYYTSQYKDVGAAVAARRRAVRRRALHALRRSRRPGPECGRPRSGG